MAQVGRLFLTRLGGPCTRRKWGSRPKARPGGPTAKRPEGLDAGSLRRMLLCCNEAVVSDVSNWLTALSRTWPSTDRHSPPEWPRVGACLRLMRVEVVETAQQGPSCCIASSGTVA
jgi:hypothetical protein